MLDLAPVRAAPGVVAVLTADDVPGDNDVVPCHRHDEPIFATGLTQFNGQPLFAVVATTRAAARAAARQAIILYEDAPAILDIDAARAAGGALVTEPLTLARGDVETALAAAPRRLAASMTIGGSGSISISRARSRSPFRARTATCWSIPRRSIPARRRR